MTGARDQHCDPPSHAAATIDHAAGRFAVALVVEAHDGPAVLLAPVFQSGSFLALHSRHEAA